MREVAQIDRLIWQDADRVSGAVCFFGTRVPVQHMFDYLQGGQTLEEFAADYHIPVDQSIGVLEVSVSGLAGLLFSSA